jgi:hypothetical protein
MGGRRGWTPNDKVDQHTAARRKAIFPLFRMFERPMFWHKMKSRWQFPLFNKKNSTDFILFFENKE